MAKRARAYWKGFLRLSLVSIRASAVLAHQLITLDGESLVPLSLA